MPYIVDEDRERAAEYPATPGELAFALTVPITAYLSLVFDLEGKVSYSDLADVVAALENVKGEFQRRVLWPYEDKKIAENGDVDWGVGVV